MAFDSKIFWQKTAAANKAIKAAARRMTRTAKSKLGAHGIDNTGELKAQVGQKTKKRDGLITQIGLKTYRYGIIREHGAGRGWPGGKKATSNQSSGPPRTPAPWISETFQEITPSLADDLSRIKGDDFVELIDESFKGTLKDRYRI